VVFGGFTMIGRRHTWSGCNPEMVV
jgi:hypothetical protein